MRKICLFALLFFYTTAVQAQSLSGLADNIIDFFSGTTEPDSGAYPVSWVIAPLLAYSPETSVQFGLGSVILFKMKNALPEDRTSSLFFSARYTLNQQVTASPTYAVFSRGEKYVHKGKLDFRKFPLFYYGIGNDTPESNEELYKINTLSMEHLTYRNVTGKLYAGAGIRFQRTYALGLEEGGLLATEQPIGSKAYTAAGLNFGLLFDNRNNLMSTTTGVLAEFKHQVHRSWLGSDFEYSLSKLDLRTYWSPFQKRNDILAWQLYAYISGGDVPFNELAPLGGDMIMRGYYQGRYLDEKFIATQAEYRMAVWKKLSAVAFVGVGDVSPQLNSFRFKELKYSLGGGVRYSVLLDENLNVRFDYAFGKDTQNFYINISEAF
ncbi:outer membrane protein assembly factor BamA [Catalinimonas alkaloidigena]|uniref:BamA/TamA family outer membrane protein n=1 Tax=Catalinimonas alkaloidigena TaxID=1075417 RepID=UPI00240686D4|nr:BamA/TamA family outer membrane protein [Catalinimonas alkaloidigena]MDF9800485.1 outer membrane protein assembly factor BamA [Catalinimonas alkaloidigena]